MLGLHMQMAETPGLLRKSTTSQHLLLVHAMSWVKKRKVLVPGRPACFCASKSLSCAESIKPRLTKLQDEIDFLPPSFNTLSHCQADTAGVHAAAASTAPKCGGHKRAIRA